MDEVKYFFLNSINAAYSSDNSHQIIKCNVLMSIKCNVLVSIKYTQEIIVCLLWEPAAIYTFDHSRRALHLSLELTLGTGSQTSLAPVNHERSAHLLSMQICMKIEDRLISLQVQIGEISSSHINSHLWMDDAKVTHNLAEGHDLGLPSREESVLLALFPVVAAPRPSFHGIIASYSGTEPGPSAQIQQCITRVDLQLNND